MRLPRGLALQPLPAAGAGRSPGRQQDVVRGAGLPAVLQDGDDAGRGRGCARRPLAVLPLQALADVVGVGGEALCGGHDPVDVNGQAFGAGRPRGAGRH